MKEKGLLVIVSGPSGAGKGTVISKLIEDDKYNLSISVTTRKARENEVEGVHYFFKDEEEFGKMIEQNNFLEYAKFCGNYYGTPISYVEEKLKEGKNVILEIEVQGALQVKEKYKDAVLIFLTPTTISELVKRLYTRDTETKDKIEMRIKRAREEIKLIEKYDYIVINSLIEEAVCNIDNIVKSEKLVARRHIDFIKRFLEEEDEIC